MEDIPLSLVEDNPFNARQSYDESEIRILANSIKQNGLISPIRVRKKGDYFEIVYGHRRVRASRMLRLSTIRADVVPVTDEEMLSLSLVENLARKDLSDYETALSFERMNKNFGKSYEEIGKIAGYSKSHVANYLRMLQLFDKETIEKNPELGNNLRRISEHHARILLRIVDPTARISALKLVVSENLSVRELETMVLKLRGWFEPKKIVADNLSSPRHNQSYPIELKTSGIEQVRQTEDIVDLPKSDQRLADIIQIQNILGEIFTVLPHQGDFEAFADHHAFESGFSIYSFFPPFQRLENKEAIEKEKEWFYKLAPSVRKSIEDMRIQFFNDVALVTLCVNYKGNTGLENLNWTVRGTVVLIRKMATWRIMHEHWSPLKDSSKSEIQVEY